ncbi:hypothetical protein [uncultured Chitinophaga sp.]|jgi:hypothetical protein|uniref:hypothetical protein n=1 Tax=uncultured Chitinophaga sp. TaxID=339340 RepID=UPI0026377DBE|nr:hypothetical protein [uncultured Chitinophaga sp.]
MLVPYKAPVYHDHNGNEITPAGKFWAGLILILFTLGSALYIVGHWPDQMPKPGDDVHAFYSYKWFDVKLQTESTTGVHINTLLLILVAFGGFLGNMIYIAASFTTYVGSGKFRKSWTLWYCVKPFSAAALAIAMYFVFRGGFLNMSDASSNINIYGLMTLSLLAGLFTDRTTLKLKEVFDVLLKPKEERPDALENNLPKVLSVTADPLEPGKAVNITLAGSHLDKEKATITIEGQPVTAALDIKPDNISFPYTLPDEWKDRESLTLSVQFEKEKEAKTFPLAVKGAATNGVGNGVQEPAADTLTEEDIVTDAPDHVNGEQPVVKE